MAARAVKVLIEVAKILPYTARPRPVRVEPITSLLPKRLKRDGEREATSIRARNTTMTKVASLLLRAAPKVIPFLINSMLADLAGGAIIPGRDMPRGAVGTLALAATQNLNLNKNI